MNYLLYGDEAYLLKEELKKIVTKHTSLDEVIYYNGLLKQFSIFNVVDDANSLSLFGEHKVIVIDNPAFLTSTGSISEAEMDFLKEYLDNPNQLTTIIFDTANINIDKRKKITKLLMKQTKAIEHNKLSFDNMKNYIKSDLISNDVKFTTEALNLIFEYIGQDLFIWKSELAKLINYQDTIDVSVVHKLVTRRLESDIFRLLDYLLTSDYDKAKDLISDLKQLNNDEIAILLIIASQIRFIYQVIVLANQGYNQESIAKVLKAHPFRVKKSMEWIYRFNNDDFLKLLNVLAEYDQGIKKGLIDKALALDLFVLETIKIANK